MIINIPNIEIPNVSLCRTLINNSKINEANKYSQNLKIKGLNFFQSDVVVISKLIKNKNYLY